MDEIVKRIKNIQFTATHGRGRRPDTQWITVALSRRSDLGVMDFENGWNDDTDPEVEKVAFRLNANGSVELRGIIKDGDLGAAAFTLPPGFRPRRMERFICANGQEGFAVVEVYPNGEVTVVGFA